jgi:predicted metal-dependent phosphoesterase TrpH
MAMPSIDLHIHTTATPHHSSWAPETLVEAALRQGLVAIAATDHNTTAGVRALREAGQRRGLQVVSGVELDSGFGGKLWHTLVYGADPEAPELLALCDAVYMSNAADAQALMQALPRYGLRLDPLADLGRPPNVADVATSLARNNELPGREPADDDEAAGMRYLLTQVPQGYNPLDVADIIAVAHKLGGVAVLAHPGRSKGVYAIPATAEDVAALAAAGLDGIEVYYPTHTPAQRALYAELANAHSLLVTGGSDSHHPHQQLAGVDAALCAQFLARLGIAP